ncbi:hypothetical protein MN608_04264 [Microdochium nivale]|nr:hypothetical protein MN608_04264 [Microdochium nivale]
MRGLDVDDDNNAIALRDKTLNMPVTPIGGNQNTISPQSQMHMLTSPWPRPGSRILWSMAGTGSVWSVPRRSMTSSSRSAKVSLRKKKKNGVMSEDGYGNDDDKGDWS